MTRPSILPKLAASLLILAPLVAVPTAMADDRRDRGRNHGDRGRGGDHHRDWRRSNHNYNHHDYRDRSRLSFSLNLGRPQTYYAPAPSYGYYAPSQGYYANAYGLRPHQCVTQSQRDYWRGQPAEVSVRICADRYGSTYIVQGSQRLIRYNRW